MNGTTPRSTHTYTLCPYSTIGRSSAADIGDHLAQRLGVGDGPGREGRKLVGRQVLLQLLFRQRGEEDTAHRDGIGGKAAADAGGHTYEAPGGEVGDIEDVLVLQNAQR